MRLVKHGWGYEVHFGEDDCEEFNRRHPEGSTVHGSGALMYHDDGGEPFDSAGRVVGAPDGAEWKEFEKECRRFVREHKDD